MRHDIETFEVFADHLSLNLPSSFRPAYATLFCAFGIGMPRSENSPASSCEEVNSV